MIERVTGVGAEDLRANQHPHLQHFLASFSRPQDDVALRVAVRMGPGDTPYIEVSADLQVNGIPATTGRMLPVLRWTNLLGLPQIADGAFYLTDEHGPYPDVLAAEADEHFWACGAEAALAAEAGVPLEHIAELRALPGKERLAAARRMNPGQNAVWQDRVALAQTAVVLL